MKLDMGRAWNDATALLAANRQVVAVVAGVFFFLPYLALVLLAPDISAEMQGSGGGEPDPEQMMAMLSGFYAEYWWAMLLLVLLQGIGMMSLLALLTDRSRPTVAEALKAGATFLLPYIGAQLLTVAIYTLALGVPIGIASASGVALLIGLVFIAAFIGFLYLFTKFSLVPPVIAIERVMNPVRALGRSWQLTRGNSVRLFFFYALIFLCLLVIALVLTIVTGLVFALMGEEVALIGNGLVAAFVNMAWIVLFLAVLAAIHRQLSGGSPEAIGETFE